MKKAKSVICLGKFFKKEPKHCTLCDCAFTPENPMRQHMRGAFIGKQYICLKCFNDIYVKAEPEVLKAVQEAKQNKHLIDLAKTREISDAITEKITKKNVELPNELSTMPERV